MTQFPRYIYREGDKPKIVESQKSFDAHMKNGWKANQADLAPKVSEPKTAKRGRK